MNVGEQIHKEILRMLGKYESNENKQQIKRGAVHWMRKLNNASLEDFSDAGECIDRMKMNEANVWRYDNVLNFIERLSGYGGKYLEKRQDSRKSITRNPKSLSQFSGIDEVGKQQLSVRPNFPNKFGTKLDQKNLKFSKLRLLSTDRWLPFSALIFSVWSRHETPFTKAYTFSASSLRHRVHLIHWIMCQVQYIQWNILETRIQ